MDDSAYIVTRHYINSIRINHQACRLRVVVGMVRCTYDDICARSEYYTQLACKDEFRQNIGSHSRSVFLIVSYNICMSTPVFSADTQFSALVKRFVS